MTLPAALKIKLSPQSHQAVQKQLLPQAFWGHHLYLYKFFHSFGDCPNNNSDRGAHGQKDGGNSHAMFFENFF